MREGTLFAVPFDVDCLETTFAFVPGASGLPAVPIHWMDGQGHLAPLRAVAARYSLIRFSPDGHRLAIQIRVGAPGDVWVYEWERDRLSLLTVNPSSDSFPVWTPNGQRIAFGSSRTDKAMPNIYWKRADGTGKAEQLTQSANSQHPMVWHPNGKLLACRPRSARTSSSSSRTSSTSFAGSPRRRRADLARRDCEDGRDDAENPDQGRR